MRLKLTTASFNASLAAHAKSLRWKHAVDLLGQMGHLRLQQTVASYGSVMKACQAGAHWEIAQSLLGQMPAKQIMPDIVNYNITLSVLSAAGEWRTAVMLLDDMVEKHVSPDVVSYNATVSACDRGHASPTVATSHLEFMTATSTSPNARTYSALMNVFSRAGDWRSVLHTLSTMRGQGIRPDPVCYSVAMSACDRASEWLSALELFVDMRSSSVHRDAVAYGNVMSAYCKAGDWQSALAMFSIMAEECVQFDTIAANIALGACARGARWLDAMWLVSEMDRRHIRKTAATCNAFVRTLEYANMLQLAMQALVKYFPAAESQEEDNAALTAEARIGSMFRSARPELISRHMRNTIADRLERALGHIEASSSEDGARSTTVRPVTAVLPSPEELFIPSPVPDRRWSSLEAQNAMDSVLRVISPSDPAGDRQAIDRLIEELRETCPAGWIDPEIHVYGSSVGGFATGVGDVDVTMMIPFSPQGSGTDIAAVENLRHQQQRALVEWRQSLVNRGWNVSATGLGGRVPVLEVKWGQHGSRSLDLTIRNGLALHKSSLLREYSLLDSRLCDLVRFVKHWARMRGVHGQPRGYLGGYGYTLLAIFAAQCVQPAIVPCLHSLAREQRLWTDDGGGVFDISWASASQVAQTTDPPVAGRDVWSTGSLVKAFFDFYGGAAFAYDVESASVRLGRRCMRAQSKTQTVVGGASMPQQQRRLSVEDPVETNWDLGQILNEERATRVREELCRASQILSRSDEDPAVSLQQLLLPASPSGCT